MKYFLFLLFAIVVLPIPVVGLPICLLVGHFVFRDRSARR